MTKKEDYNKRELVTWLIHSGKTALRINGKVYSTYWIIYCLHNDWPIETTGSIHHENTIYGKIWKPILHDPQNLTLFPAMTQHNKSRHSDDLKKAQQKRLIAMHKPGVQKRAGITRGQNRRGYKQSEETKRKISKTLTGKKHSKEAKRNMSKAQKGRIFSEEHKRKISEAKKGKTGRKHSEETKRKMSNAHKLRFSKLSILETS